MTDTVHSHRSNTAPSDREGVRHVVHEGRDHLVVPVVMIVEGVLNGALVTQAEFGKFAESWNGRPVPVLHPEERGIPISANRPDVIERNTIGQVFNAYAENGKLKGELWIDTDKAQRLGHGDLMRAMEAGQIIEVSTGYFAEDEPSAGEYAGTPYQVIHRNIRPDHLALLPGEVGACSVLDGCGTRVNSRKDNTIMAKTKDAFNALARSLGLRANCNCQHEEESMTDKLKAQAEKLKANGALSAKQYQMLADMDDDALAMVSALVEALRMSPAEPEAAETEEEPPMEDNEYEDKNAMNANAFDPAKLEELVANRVADHLRRADVTAKLIANEKCPFDADELKAMSVDHLEKLEKSIRPADYSGQGGMATNSSAIDTNVSPLVPRAGLLAKKEA